jgi:hypothetical protein
MRRFPDEELPIPIGHNGGPPLDDGHRPPWGTGDAFVYLTWKKARNAAWKGASRDVTLFRLRRAEAAGVSYQDYMLALLDRGERLQAAPRAEDEAI